MKRNKTNKITIFLLIILVALSSCSTKKKTYFHRKYHNITAKYNGYFNGKESLKYGIIKLEKSHKDDYSKILNVYKISEIKESKAHHAYMDKSIKKGSIVIQKHSIKIKNKEYCKWIDDSYFLVARAYFYKGEFLEAKKTFEFIKNNYKKTDIAYESELWIAKCYIQLGDYNSAEIILDELKTKRRFPNRLDKDLHITLSDLYLKQNLNSDAADELKSACNLIRGKKKKSRFYYIIAQIYQEKGNIKKSKEYFELVLNTNPEYEMVFNAKMNLARSLRSKKDLNKMNEKLLRMIKDEKNTDYLDQIYFTLAEMNLIQEDTSSAIENLNLSTKYSLDNDIQKSQSFLQLGKIHYYKKKYPSSKVFYDSAYTFMPESHSEYETVKKTQKTLENLITHLNTISLQDSLQTLANMSEEERKQVIQSVIQEVIKKEQEQLRDRKNQIYRGGDPRNRRNENFGEGISGGKWYFYNQATLSFGLSEFRKIWGKRKLEDDWRRSNKKSLSTIEGDSLSKKTKENKGNKDLKSEQYYLDQIPLTKEDIQTSNNKIINAYYEASVIYKENLNEILESEKMLDQLVKRFPKHNELTPLSYYLIYSSQIEYDEEKANQTKQKLIENFPKSSYAQTLLDTNYIKLVINQKKKKEKEYNDVFNLYISEEYLQSLNQASEKLNKSTDNSKYMSKYYLINILSEFKLYSDTLIFIKNLEKGIQDYKNTETSTRCSEILNILRSPNQMNRRNEIAVLKSPYTYKEISPHYITIITPKDNTDINFIRTLISDFNRNNFSNETIEINSMMFGIEKHLIIIKTFENRPSSENYYNMLFANNEVVNELSKTDFIKLIISQENFTEFYKNKDIEEYTIFYNNKYTNETN